MRSWVFRNRRRLETIYGSAGRGRPLTETRVRPRPGNPESRELRLQAYEIIPSPRRSLRRAG